MIKKHDTPQRVRKAVILMMNSDNRKQNLSEHAWLLYFALVTVDLGIADYRPDYSRTPQFYLQK